MDDVTPPEVEILEPLTGENVAPEASVLVRVAISDRRGVVRVNIAALDPATGQTVGRLEGHQVVFPNPVRDTVLEVSLASGAAVGTEPVRLVVTARDQAGNEGMDHVTLSVGGPRVSVREPVAGRAVRADSEIPVQVHASDDAGVSWIYIELTGVGRDSVIEIATGTVKDTVVTHMVPIPGELGELHIRARAQNVAGIVNRSPTVTVSVVSDGAEDITPPRVAFDVVSPTRVELTDSIRVMVMARDDDDGVGLARLGVTLVAARSAGDTVVWTDTHSFARRHGLVEHEFVVGIDELYAALAGGTAGLGLPDTLQIEFHALAWDGAEPTPNCAAATGTSLGQAPCGQRTVAGTTVPVAQNVVARRADVTVVAGQTISLPASGVIADAVVHRDAGQLYLSNFSHNRVERLDLQTLTFQPGGVLVGGQPWGLFLDNTGDNLIVANSGGTNLDFVPLDAAGLPAGVNTRLQTPNLLLWQINQREDDGGRLRYTPEWIDFSDRPQFVAQDSLGRLLYSTVPTAAARDGTVRVLWNEAGWERLETEMIMLEDVENENSYAVANVDGITECQINANQFGVIMAYRLPGETQQRFTTCAEPFDAAEQVRTAVPPGPGPRIDFRPGRTWGPGWSDTTFVAASGDRGTIVFGEGAVNVGRIVMWDATGGASEGVEVRDLIHNEPARITGLDLNKDGRLGVARGSHGAYFFGKDLRLYGRAVEGLGGGAGAALHPEHTGTGWAPSAEGMAFVGSDDRSIQILDAGHFTMIGEIPVRDRIVGPLRVSLPLAGDPADTLVRVYAVTAAGGVVLVRVRQSDLTQF